MEIYWIGNMSIMDDAISLSHGGTVPVSASEKGKFMVSASEHGSFLYGRDTVLFVADITKSSVHGVSDTDYFILKSMCEKLAGELFIDECGRRYTGKDLLREMDGKVLLSSPDLLTELVSCPLFKGRKITAKQCSKLHIYNLNRYANKGEERKSLKCYNCKQRAKIFKGETKR